MTIYAHRGIEEDDQPQNGKAALLAAQAAGYGFETDLRLTSDLVPVLFHDRVVGGVAVSDMTHAELNIAAATEVPTLEWLIANEWRHPVNLEIKTMAAWTVARAAIRSWPIPADRLLISSFDHEVAEAACDAGMEAARLYASAAASRDAIPAARAGLSTAVLDMNIAKPDFIERLRHGGHRVIVYGAETPREHGYLFTRGLDGVITDHAGMARAAGFGARA